MAARRGWSSAAVLLALMLLAATFPMRLTLAWSGATDAGVAAREVRGSVWSGELVEARLGALPLGTVRASLSPLALLGGSVELAFSRTDERLGALAGRSEEHTSELQSLMRISYAVFCLKKKTKLQHTTREIETHQ